MSLVIFRVPPHGNDSIDYTRYEEFETAYDDGVNGEEAALEDRDYIIEKIRLVNDDAKQDSWHGLSTQGQDFSKVYLHLYYLAVSPTLLCSLFMVRQNVSSLLLPEQM